MPRRLGESLKELLESPSCRLPGASNLFPGNIPGRSLTARQARVRFERWKTAAGIRAELTIHSFRAGFATALHRATGDAVLVSRALGHRDLRPTLRYVEPNQEELPRAIERAFAGVARGGGSLPQVQRRNLPR